MTLTLANQHFTFGLTTEDQIRREGYFRNPNNPAFSLTPEERRVLDVLGIDNVMENSMRHYLSKFFMALPHCQTDASLFLSKACEIPYYVIWSTQFGMRQKIKDVYDLNQAETTSRSNIEMAEDSAMIDSLQPVPKPNDIVREIFTLISNAPAPSLTQNVPQNAYVYPTSPLVKRIFTLIAV
jgi:hypothetical protein